MGREIDEIIEDLKDIENLDEEEAESLSNDLYELSCSIKAEIYNVPEIVAEAGLLLSFRDKLSKEFKELEKKKKMLNKFIIDAYHILGLAKIDGVEIMQIASIFRGEMKRRFKVKDKCKLLRILQEVINNNNKLFNEMDKALKKIYRKIDEFGNRGFIPRTKLGKQLVDRFSKEDDDLRIGISEKRLKDLEDSLNQGVG